MANLKVSNCMIADIISEVKSGQTKIPQFQRKYVWAVNDCAKLMDSILKGYPVGSLIYWKTKEHLRSVRNVGNISFPNAPTDDFVYYVLDGQQRITSIIASINGETVNGEDYSKIYVNLLATEEDDIVTTNVDGLAETDYISLKELTTASIMSVVGKYGASGHIEKISSYKDRISQYPFSKIELTDATIDVATEVFTRINTSGKSLSIFEIMCAKMYSESPSFDLYEKRETQRAKWQMASYETISDATVLQAMGVCIDKSCKGKDILGLDKSKFISEWDKVDAAFDLTIDYFKNSYNVPVSKLMPYDALIVPFVYYFYKTGVRPSGNAQKYLQDYFWRSTFSERFTEGAVSKINQDITDVIDVILGGNQPTYSHGVVITPNSITREGYFTTGSAYVKGILCILCAQRPVSFMDGHQVTIDNSWLSQGNSKNYHHFFPKAYMSKHQPLIPEAMVNHVVNIAIVDGWLNKSQIKDKAPSVYMANYIAINSNIDQHMKTHFIDDLTQFGVLSDDYNVFFAKRLEAIHKAMVALLVPTKDDVLS